MFKRSANRQLQTVTIARSSRALLACAVTTGLAFQVAAHPAKAEEQVTAEAYLADLVNKLSEAKDAVSDLELEMGGLRESANKARVDLSKAQKEAQKAQDSVVDARSRLTDSDKAVAKAQDDLDEIARSAYASGGDASPITLAAGEDAAGDSLDRASYIRLATERQQGTVDRLDLARTQTANEESQLRDDRATADKAVSDAVRAHNDANDALTSSQKELRNKRGEYDRLIAAQSLAQKKLNAARKAVNAVAGSKPDASSWDKRRAAEAAVNRVEERGEQPEETPAEQQEITPYTESAADVDTNTSAATPAQNSNNAGDSADSTENGATDPTVAQQADAQGEVVTPAENETAPQTRATNEGAAAPAGPQAPVEPAAGSGDALAQLNNVPAQFAASSEGDEQRQLAIDGLLRAGGAAAMAGFTAYAEGGDQTAALNAALAAGRETAGQQYDQAQAQLGAPTGESPTATDPISDIAEGINNAASGAASEATAEADDTVDTSGDAAAKIERVIERAQSQLGMPYAWGGGNWHGPTLGIRDGGVGDAHGDYAKVGFDCSGLMMYAFYAVGFQLDHYSGSQYNAGRQVPVSEIKRGDMLFWGAGGSQHVALYLGDGKMIEAPQSGDVVKISDVRYGGMTPMAVRMIE